MIVAEGGIPFSWTTPDQVSPTLESKTGSNVIWDNRLIEQAPILSTKLEISRLTQLYDNWDDRGSKAPSLDTIEKSKNFLCYLHKNFSKYHIFRQPFVSVSEGGEVVFEWWNKNKKLTVYIGDNEVEYLKSWGANIFNEMEEGELDDSNVIGIWHWLESSR